MTLPTKKNSSRTTALRRQILLSTILSLLMMMTMMAPARDDQGRRSANAPHEQTFRLMIVMTKRRRHDATPNKPAFGASTSPAIY
jgi:hypothetical protein